MNVLVGLLRSYYDKTNEEMIIIQI